MSLSLNGSTKKRYTNAVPSRYQVPGPRFNTPASDEVDDEARRLEYTGQNVAVACSPTETARKGGVLSRSNNTNVEAARSQTTGRERGCHARRSPVKGEKDADANNNEGAERTSNRDGATHSPTARTYRKRRDDANEWGCAKVRRR